MIALTVERSFYFVANKTEDTRRWIIELEKSVAENAAKLEIDTRLIIENPSK